MTSCDFFSTTRRRFIHNVVGIGLALAWAGEISVLAAETPMKHTFSIGEQDFLLDGNPFQIRSGEMHAARIPTEYWRHRLQMVRAMGCNTVCAYLFWNQHEPQPGKFDFTGAADAAEYCRIAQEVGLKVILRPGPYSCAEWEFGGFPWWLLKTPDIKLRTRDPRYLEACRRYLCEVGKQLASLQITRGGPIIMVQVENEYGSYGNDKEYIGLLRDCLKEDGFEVPFFTCDGTRELPRDTRPDIFCVVNFGKDPKGGFAALRKVRAKGPLMCGEFYPGWFDSWGEAHHTGSTANIVRDLGWMLENKGSFSIYMAHGGTTFGFAAGANCPPFSPESTSYDYDAPIDEAGRATPKFHAIRDLFAKHLLPGETLPDIPPAPHPLIVIPTVTLKESAPLFANLGQSRNTDKLLTMEQCDQPTGCILYRAKLPAGPAAPLRIEDAHDIARVFVDGKRVGMLDRRHPKNSILLDERRQPVTLDILIEAMGRVNYGAAIYDRKGITDKVVLANAEVNGWEIFTLPLDAPMLATLKFSGDAVNVPSFYRGSFALEEVGDTFLDMRGWGHGAVWVNGHNLGRFWHIGPQQTLFLPGCWLNKGQNEIIVLDLDPCGKQSIQGLKEPILNMVMTE